MKAQTTYRISRVHTATGFWRNALGLILAVAILSGCNGAAGQPVTVTTPTPAAVQSNTLKILNYDTYIDPNVLTTFQAQTGVVLQYDIFETQGDMYEIIKNGETAYDLVVVTDYLVPVMKSEGLLSPLNKENIPNISNIDPDFANPAFDPGSRFCIPYQWGTIGVAYNSKIIRAAPRSWKDLFQERYSGRVALLDDSRAMMGIVLLSMGYSPNTTDALEIAQMEQFLLDNQDKVQSYAPDTGQDLLASGDADIVIEYNGDILQLQAENPDYQYAIPREGTIQWIDSICIPANSQNQALAERFLDYMLQPEVSAAISNYTRYSTANLAAMPFIIEADRTNPALYPSDEIRRKLFLIVDVGTTTNTVYDTAWQKILASANP